MRVTLGLAVGIAILSAAAVGPEFGASLKALGASLSLRNDVRVSYEPGERIDAHTVVWDSTLTPVLLEDVLRSGPSVTVVVLFGGATLEKPPGMFRGPLWCQDSFDDLAIQRALVNSFPPERVRFLGIAAPPVFTPARYGFPEDLLKGGSPPPGPVRDALKAFAEATEDLRKTGLLPYHELYYDPQLSLLYRPPEDLGAAQWWGRWKWKEDDRRYGLPTMWVVDSQGFILTSPLWGNDYGSRPPHIRYGYNEALTVVQEALKKVSLGGGDPGPLLKP
ncbi:MAG TPA: hypothetical protein P5568_07250 [Acidobacteriota bacterium]|nr:hypothetical protein [Acidobacteriota bacterium]